MTTLTEMMLDKSNRYEDKLVALFDGLDQYDRPALAMAMIAVGAEANAACCYADPDRALAMANEIYQSAREIMLRHVTVAAQGVGL